mmetsp:Transcript_22187/g.48126  ORF Transcript_22187/g.48126 Transcript_22187/m.48126 type:complete len:354 (+) Transcript_22187:157-1218(+)
MNVAKKVGISGSQKEWKLYGIVLDFLAIDFFVCLIITATIIVSKHTTTNGRSFFFLLFFLNLLFFSFSRATSAAATPAGSSEFARISKVFLNCISLVKRVVFKLNGNRQDGLVSIGNAVRNTGLRGVSQSQGNGGKSIESRSELHGKNFIGDIKNLGIKEGSIIVHLLQHQTIGKGLNTKFLKESSLRGSNLITGLNKVGIVHHLNLTSSNFGGDLQSLEKGGLTGITTSGSLWHNNLRRSDGTDTGRSGTGVCLKDFTDFSQIIIGENKSNVATANVGQLAGRRRGILFGEFLDALSHHGVLTHENLGLSTQFASGHLELLTTNIINLNNECLGVVRQKRLQLFEVLSLAFC